LPWIAKHDSHPHPLSTSTADNHNTLFPIHQPFITPCYSSRIILQPSTASNSNPFLTKNSLYLPENLSKSTFLDYSSIYNLIALFIWFHYLHLFVIHSFHMSLSYFTQLYYIIIGIISQHIFFHIFSLSPMKTCDNYTDTPLIIFS